MRDLLEELPHALLPDPTRESEDPGLGRDAQDDDLVRPAAEEDLPIDAHRSRRSPLARHVDIVVAPFDPRLSTPIGLTMAIEGQRVRNVALDVGMVHQGIERRAVGLDVRGPELASLLALVEPAPLAGLAVAVAVEGLTARAPDAVTRWWRHVVVDLVACAAHARVLADVLRREPGLATLAHRIAVTADAARLGLDVEHRFACIHGLRSPVPDDERLTLVRRIGELRAAAARLTDRDVDDALVWLRGAGVLDVDRCRALGIDGPALTAAGATSALPADLGEWLGREIVTTSGCAVGRATTRLAELRAAASRLGERIGSAPPDTPMRNDSLAPRPLHGTASALVRGPGGTWVVHVVLEDGVVRRLRLRPPDLPLLAGVARALRGVRLDDVSEVFASFGLRAAAIDR
jgi:Ni,Fe-hydrogenase III large subunit